ncbi:sensor histidine kinase [Virgibacillus sp. L01]|uniref:sensor histidine kinase n=1 Tax=Virgibacillus sp. L01 TaxID=3457429 RepID=UPI003FD50ED6
MSFKLSSINSKLFLIIISFVCIPLLILGNIWYEKTTTAIKNNAVQYSQHLLKQTNEYLDFYLNDLEQATVPFLSASQVQTYLELDPKKSNRYERFLISQQIQEDSFASILDGRSDIYGISLVNKKGMQIHNYVKVDEVLNMREIRKRNTRLWSNIDNLEPYQILEIDFIYGTPVLTIVRKIYDNNTYETSGLLIVNLRLNKIADIISEVTLSHFNNVLIVNNQKEIIYHPDQRELGQTFLYKQNENNNEDRFLISSIDSKKTLNVYDYSSKSNWTMVASVPLGKIMSSLMTLRNSTIWTGLLLIGVALVLVGGFSFFLTHSLTNLQQLMKKVESGNFKIKKKKPFPFYRNDEVTDLYNSFYTMTDELKRLIEEVQHSKGVEKELELKKRESELKAMQSQINPHFLYNTLEIINSYAIIEGQMMISRMTTSLADMFRYNVSNSKSVVTLQEEIDQIRSYLQIQKERFDDLDVTYEFEENEILDVLTARLTIQPIIENAFIHGYEEHALSPSFIGIHGKKEPHYYTLYLVDLGQGMSKKTRDDFNHAFEYLQDPPTENKTTKRIGLINVHNRIRGNFGHPFGIYIKRSDLQGTTIEVRLPYTSQARKKED